jgi:hypothetical protein
MGMIEAKTLTNLILATKKAAKKLTLSKTADILLLDPALIEKF